MPGTLLISSSSGVVICVSMICALAPGYEVLTEITAGSTEGNSRTPRNVAETSPKITRIADITVARTGRRILIEERLIRSWRAGVRGGVRRAVAVLERAGTGWTRDLNSRWRFDSGASGSGVESHRQLGGGRGAFHGAHSIPRTQLELSGGDHDVASLEPRGDLNLSRQPEAGLHLPGLSSSSVHDKDGLLVEPRQNRRGRNHHGVGNLAKAEPDGGEGAGEDVPGIFCTSADLNCARRGIDEG